MSNPIEKFLIPQKNKKKKTVKMNTIFNNVKNNKTIKIKTMEEDTSVNGSNKQIKYNQFISEHREVL